MRRTKRDYKFFRFVFPQKTSVTKKTTTTQDKEVPHNMGKSDLIRASDFNFLMVLGKGSFGKVWLIPSFSPSPYSFTLSSYRILSLSPPEGYAGREERYRRAVRDQDFEEGYHHSGRRRGVHHGRETRVGVVHQAAIFGPTTLLLPNHGSPLFRDGIRERWGFDVSDTTVWQVQRACRCVSDPLQTEQPPTSQ